MEDINDQIEKGKESNNRENNSKWDANVLKQENVRIKNAEMTNDGKVAVFETKMLFDICILSLKA